MDDTTARRAADWLLAEHKAGHRFTTPSSSEAPASMTDAYDIQDHYVALLRPGKGEPVGYKVGLTSAAMQAFCKIDHPIAGVVLASRVHQSGAKIRRAEFGRLGLEFEIAVRIKSDIPVTGATHTIETIAPHIDGVCAAIELVDDRAADYANIDVRCLVADNSWNAGIVLSDFRPTWPDLAPLLGRATENGNVIGEGYGRDILGHPFNSVAWLASQLASRGAALKAGQIVMTGSVMKTVFPEHDTHVRFDIEGLGAVETNVSA
jgi:2-keto-4-pentenoate hydratase